MQSTNASCYAEKSNEIWKINRHIMLQVSLKTRQKGMERRYENITVLCMVHVRLKETCVRTCLKCLPRSDLSKCY